MILLAMFKYVDSVHNEITKINFFQEIMSLNNLLILATSAS